MNSNGGVIKKLTKPQIASLALKFFGTPLVLTKPKDDLIAALQKEITAKPTAHDMAHDDGAHRRHGSLRRAGGGERWCGHRQRRN